MFAEEVTGLFAVFSSVTLLFLVLQFGLVRGGGCCTVYLLKR